MLLQPSSPSPSPLEKSILSHFTPKHWLSPSWTTTPTIRSSLPFTSHSRLGDTILRALQLQIDVVTNHKNLEYFFTTKILSRRQACWSELLSQFNLVICFYPRRLGAKPDALTRWWDIYLKGGDSNYATINPHNFHPVFTQEQLASSLRATIILSPVLWAMSLMDIEQLHSDICSALSIDPIASIHIKSEKSDP